jgi:hypothetical protein
MAMVVGRCCDGCLIQIRLSPLRPLRMLSGSEEPPAS